MLDLRVDRLPTDADALDALLREELAESSFYGYPDTPSRGMLTVVGQLLAHPLARPALRAALYEVAAKLEDADVQEHTDDPDGRPATVISVSETSKDGMPTRFEFFFDPRTSETLATRDTIVENRPRFTCREADGARGTRSCTPTTDPVRSTLTQLSVYEKHGSVGSIHSRP